MMRSAPPWRTCASLLTLALCTVASGCIFDRTGVVSAGPFDDDGMASGGAGGAGVAGAGGSASAAGGMGGAIAGGGGQGGAGGSETSVCGDGQIEGAEACDDGNVLAGDGCGEDCRIEEGYECGGVPSSCTPIPPTVTGATNIGLSILDDGSYNGSIGSMQCHSQTISTGLSVVQWVQVEVGIDHPFIGDLVIKLVSPADTVTTLMHRPGAIHNNDTTQENPNGDSSNLEATDPISFGDDYPYDAEQMGDTGGDGLEVCQDDGRCRFRPNAGPGPGNGLADFEGESPNGSWRLCVADADDVDAGTLQSVQLRILAW